MGTPLLWVGFNLFVLLAVALDLGVFHRKAHKIELQEAALWSVIWIALAVVFGSFLWHWFGAQRGLEYFTGYVIEKAFSIDNPPSVPASVRAPSDASAKTWLFTRP